MSTVSKRPPKLRAACNECHAAKVRCSGEKSGCQRCANLRLVCVFSISRIGKVPGKRSKANRAAAAAAAAAAASVSASNSTSTAASSTTSLATPPLTSPNEAPSPLRMFSSQSPKAEAALRYPISASHTVSGFVPDPAFAPVALQDCTNAMVPLYSADDGSSGHLPFPEGIPTPCGLSHNLSADPIGLGISEPGGFCWPTDLEQPLGSCATASVPVVEPPVVKAAPPHFGFSSRRRLSHDWDVDCDAASSGCDLGGTSRSSCTTSTKHPATPPEPFPYDRATCANPGPHLTAYPFPINTRDGRGIVGMGPDTSCTAYLHLLHEIEQTLVTDQQSTDKSIHTLDAVLAANQRCISALLTMSESPGFGHLYDDAHLLFTVALSKIITLFDLGYADFTVRLDARDPLGCGPIRFGVFEIDFMEQKAICRGIFLQELKRARVCLTRLMSVLGKERAGGRMENLCEAMSKRVDHLVSALERADARI